MLYENSSFFLQNQMILAKIRKMMWQNYKQFTFLKMDLEFDIPLLGSE